MLLQETSQFLADHRLRSLVLSNISEDVHFHSHLSLLLYVKVIKDRN
jgi:hypothetical protein